MRIFGYLLIGSAWMASTGGCSADESQGAAAASGGAEGQRDAAPGELPGSGGMGGRFFQPGSQDAGDPANCGAVVQRAKEVVVTTIEYSPVAVFVMQDRSSSMGTNLGDPSRWPAATNALTAFVESPESEGMDFGIGFFPPLSNAVGDCMMGTDCGEPVAPIAKLPDNATPVRLALARAAPNAPETPQLLTPTECALRGMVNTCIDHQANSGDPCVGVLVTDGEPTTCTLPDPFSADPNGVLVDIVREGASQGVAVFAVALPGAEAGLPLLMEVAAAGGTELVDLTAGGTAEALLTALNDIRKSVVEETTVESKIDCTWQIPEPPNGQALDRDRVNVRFSSSDVGDTVFGRVASREDCERAAEGTGWYYDDPDAPKEILVCPRTCEVVKAATDAVLNIEFGCATIPAKLI